MESFSCHCGAALYFENTRCLGCGSEVGWCPACRGIRALLADGDDLYRCANPSCGSPLRKCHNYAVENVCNRTVVAAEQAPALCDCCVYNDTIPDLEIEGNRRKWGRMERAKRRLFYTLDRLGLPHGTAAAGFEPPLGFDFKADLIPENEFWRVMGEGERVYTGHDSGKITINIREADHAERERMRVELEEAHRTVIGHFRHEIGHYYWDLLVRGRREPDSVRVFGDHASPTYQEALERHYRDGPPADWRVRFISAYASMHPWEDFAETFASYLEMTAALDAAATQGLVQLPDVANADFTTLLENYRRLGIAMNEMNRTMGLLDFVPVIFVAPVVEKVELVHDLVREAAGRPRG